MKKHYLPLLIVLSFGFFNILNVNAQIFFGNNPDATAILNKPFTYQVAIQSSIPDAPTFSLSVPRPGMTINATTGLISWTPSNLIDGGKAVVTATNTGFSKSDTILFFVSEGFQWLPGTVAYWELDDYSDSYNTHNGTAVGSPTDVAGIAGRARSFNGSNTGIDVADHADFHTPEGESFSVSFWFNSAKDNHAGKTEVMVGKIYDEFSQWWIGFDVSVGDFTFYTRAPGGAHLTSFISPSQFSADTWYHVVCLYDAVNDQMRSYINKNGALPGGPVVNHAATVEFDVDAALEIGKFADSYNFEGVIDELVYFKNHALEQAEIDSLYDRGISGRAAFPAGNSAPVFTSDPVISVNEDSPYSYKAVAQDIDVGDVLAFTDSIPAWLSFNGSTQILSGTPTNADVGVYPVTLRVSDGEVTVRQKFNLTVVNVNDTPQITSSPVLTVNEETAYSYDVDATDVDAGDVITYSLTQKPAWLSINSTSGVISGTPALNDTGSYDVTVRATDVALAFAEQSYTLDIRNVNDAPAITGQNPNPLTVDEDNSLLIELANIVYTDVDNPSGDITLTVLSGNNYTFSGNTITPAENYSGSLSVNIQLSDLLANTAGAVAVTVNPVNDVPVITSTPVIAVNEDDPYIYNITYSDVDAGDVLTLSAVTIPPWLQLNAGQGTLTGTATNDQVGMNSTAIFTVKIKISDGTLDSTQTFNVTVTNINDAPEITGQKDTLQAAPNGSVTLQLSNINVADVDDLTADLTLTVLPGSNYTIAGNTVIISSDAGIGLLPVNIRVSDPDNAKDEDVYQVRVLATGIEDMQYTATLVHKVYPTPATEYVVFEFNPANQLMLQIIDITGKVMMEKTVGYNESKLQINIRGLNSGLYFYKAYSDNKYQIGRFIISNN